MNLCILSNEDSVLAFESKPQASFSKQTVCILHKALITKPKNQMRAKFILSSKNSLSIVFKRKLKENIDFSATWVYGSGFPITLAVGKYKTITTKEYFGNTGSILTYDEYAHIYERKNGFRMRDYHRLDVGINFNKKKTKGTRTWSLNIYNAYNRKNPFYYYIVLTILRLKLNPRERSDK